MQSKKKKTLIIVISIAVVLIVAGVFAYNQFFTYKISQIDANNVSKIVYIVDANVDPNKFVKREITDPQDIKNFLDIYRDVTFQKKLSGNDTTGLNPDINIFEKSGQHETWLRSSADYLFNGKDYYTNSLTTGNEYAAKAKAIADKYKEQPYK